jgi:hypothetical protein
MNISKNTGTVLDPDDMPVTEQWDIVEPLFERYLTRLCGDDVDGQLSRRAAVEILEREQSQDGEPGPDDAARPMICTLLRRLDADFQAKRGNAAGTAYTLDALWSLLHALKPSEVIALFDGIVPKVELETNGSPNEIFAAAVQKWQEKNEPATRLPKDEPEIREADGMAFSETRADKIVDRMFAHR